MYLSSISSLIAKGLNTYVTKVFLFFVCITCVKSLCSPEAEVAGGLRGQDEQQHGNKHRHCGISYKPGEGEVEGLGEDS